MRIRVVLGFFGLAAGAAAVGRARTSAASSPVTKFPETASGFVVPLDSAPHSRTWMAWPDSRAVWGSLLTGAQVDIARIARTIAAYEPVVMCANPASVSRAQRACGPRVSVIGTIPVDDCWMRDTGPIFRLDQAGSLDAVGLNFNGWGHKQTHAKDALVARRIAAYVGVPFTTAGFVGEGGAIETDGSGTLMATKSSLLNSNRNADKTRAQIEWGMREAFGASKVIWFPGLEGRDLTDDHVDATSRFVGPGRAVVQTPFPSETDVWAKDGRQQFQALSRSSDAEGKVVVVTRVRGPDYNSIRSTDPAFVGSYANYYVCNGAVISAQFGDAATDRAAKSNLANLFPGRVIEQLNIDTIGAGGGGVHCVTQPQPAPR